MKAFVTLLLAAASLLATGCASIVSRSKWDVTVETNPPGQAVTVTVKDFQGVVVGSGTTPLKLTLKSGRGYFRKARYTVEADTGATAELRGTFNRWYIGNFFIPGGVIGLLLVDPLTGAMYKLPESVTLDVGSASSPSGMPYQ